MWLSPRSRRFTGPPPWSECTVWVRLTLVCMRAVPCVHSRTPCTLAQPLASVQIELIWRYFDADWWFFALRASRGCAQCTLRAGRLSVAPLRRHGRRGNDTCAPAQGSGSGALPRPATSAPGLGSPRPHLHPDWAYPGHICTWTGLTHAHRVVSHRMFMSAHGCACPWTGAQRIWLTLCSRLCVGCDSLRYRRG